MAKKEKIVKEGATEVTVTWKGGSRVYSLKVHGEDFMALAEEFVKKHDGKIVE